MVKPKLYVHIGLPKTATTSLQSCFFPNLDGYVRYLGVSQPRGSKSEDIHSDWVSLVESEYADFERLLPVVRQRLNAEIATGDVLLISEEGFVIDSPFVSWQDKIARLAKLLDGIEVVILVTLREPIKGAHSLYVELYYQLRRKYASFADFLFLSNQARIWKFDNLHRVIRASFGSASIRYIPFEDFTMELKISDFFPELLLGGVADKHFLLERLNVKNERNGRKFADAPTIHGFLQSIVTDEIKHAIRSFPLLKNSIKWVLSVIGGLHVGRKGAVVKSPSILDQVEMEAYLADGDEAFTRLTGFRYRSGKLEKHF